MVNYIVMLESIFLVGFLVILMWFGYGAATHGLGLKNPVAIVGISATFGTATYMVLANAFGYLFGVPWSFWIALGTLGCFAVMCCVIPQGLCTAGKEKTDVMCSFGIPSRTWWTLLPIALMSGIAAARYLTSDPWAWSYLPLIATIAEGNFPVHEPMNPANLATYHYGPQLFAAAISSVAGTSIATALNIQPFIGTFGTLFLGAALARPYTKTWSGATLPAVLLLGASGLQWFNGGAFLHALGACLTGGECTRSSFGTLTTLFTNIFGQSLLQVFGSRTYTLGIPFILGFLFCMQQLLTEVSRKNRMCTTAIAIVWLLALGLTMESAFVVLGAAMILWCTYLFCDLELDTGIHRCRIWGTYAAIFIPSTILVAIQGGVITAGLLGNEGGTASFAWNDGTLPLYFPGGGYIPWWHWNVLRDLGLPFLLLPVSGIWCWRMRQKFPLLILLWLFAAFHGVLPLVIRYLPRHNEMLRLLHVAQGFSGFIVGIMLLNTFLRSTTLWKRI